MPRYGKRSRAAMALAVDGWDRCPVRACRGPMTTRFEKETHE